MSRMFRKILCPVDFDELSMAALDVAVELAVQNDASLILLNVAPLPLGETEMSPVPLDPYPFREETAREQLEKVGRERVGDKVSYEIFVDSADPATGVLNAIHKHQVDLVVMGTHGRKGIGHILLGSVAERVVRESPVPVLSVRQKVARECEGTEVPKAVTGS